MYVHQNILALKDGKDMASLLRAKAGSKGWRVVRLPELEKVVEVHDALSKVDTLLTDLIDRTKPAVTRRAVHRIRGSIRVAKFGYTSRRRLNDPAISRLAGHHVAMLFSTSCRRLNHPAGSYATSSAGRRHALPRLVPPQIAQELLEAGNVLQHMRLHSVQMLGEAVAAAGLALLRQYKDRAALHAQLLEVEEQLRGGWTAGLRVKDL